MKKNTSRSAFTLIELMTASSIALIVLAACGTMLASMMTNSLRSQALLQLNRTAQQVFALCEEGIRTATLDDINDTGGNLIVGGDNPFSIRQSDSSIIFDSDPANAGDTTLAEGAVANFTAALVTGPPRVHLQLQLVDPRFSELSYNAEYDLIWRNTNERTD